MSRVEVRELRDSLSRHLAKVRTGHTITVTDHGRPVARLVPVDASTKLEQLLAGGRVTPSTRHKGSRPIPVRTQGLVTDLVEPQRR